MAAQLLLMKSQAAPAAHRGGRGRRPAEEPASTRGPSWCGGCSSTRSTGPPPRSWARHDILDRDVFTRRARAERPGRARRARTGSPTSRSSSSSRRSTGRSRTPSPRSATRWRSTGSPSPTPSAGWPRCCGCAGGSPSWSCCRPPGGSATRSAVIATFLAHPGDGQAAARPDLPGAGRRGRRRGGDPGRGARDAGRRRAAQAGQEDYR